MSLLSFYYSLKPFIPRRLQIMVRRMRVRNKLSRYRDVWPIDQNAGNPPEGWHGWPDNKKFALVLIHDVETMRGQEKCALLMELEQKLGFRSSFNFVPEGYPVWPHLRSQLTANGFEVGVHGLKHDGKLYLNRQTFEEKAGKINRYLREWNVVGFSSPSMHRNLEWTQELNIRYDISTFDTDPFEPQPQGIGTIFPFRVKSGVQRRGYIELPYTLPQDFTLFAIMKEKNIDIWKRKLDWIADKGGMALLNTHPDYMNFGHNKLGVEEYPVEYYAELLKYIRKNYEGLYWHILPKTIAEFFEGQNIPPRNIDQHRKKNICMIAYTHYPSDARVRREAEALAALPDHEVTCLVLKENYSPKTYTMDGVKVFELKAPKYRGKSNRSYITAYLYFLFLSFLKCTGLFLSRRFDIVHIHNMPDFLIFAAIIPRLFGKKVILDIHDTMPETYLAKFGERRYGVLLKILCWEEAICCWLAHRIICVNHLQRNALTERGIHAEKILVSLNMPDPKKFPRHEDKCDNTRKSGEFKIVYHGMLSKRLGVDLAIHAVSRLINKIPSLKFYIIGIGDDMEEFVELSNSLGLGDSVFFNKKMIPVEGLATVLETMDLGVISNRKNIATDLMLPVKMLEYVYLGIPVVTPRLKGIQYYFTDEMVTYFEPDDIDTLVSSILELYGNKDIMGRKRQAARAFLDTYGWDKHRFAFIDFYNSL